MNDFSDVVYKLQEPSHFAVRPLILESGKSPFLEWIEGLRDLKARSIVWARLRRTAAGNFGNCRDLKGALWEIKIDLGPGYRVYFGKVENRIILLLTGGDKSSQERDIQKAREYWNFFMENES